MSNAQQQNEAEEELATDVDDDNLEDRWLAISKRARERVENSFK